MEDADLRSSVPARLDMGRKLALLPLHLLVRFQLMLGDLLAAKALFDLGSSLLFRRLGAGAIEQVLGCLFRRMITVGL